MNSRERVKKALNHEPTDRVPIDLGGYQSGMCWRAYKNVKEFLIAREEVVELSESPYSLNIFEPLQSLARVDEGIKELFGVDTRYVHPKAPSNWELNIQYGKGKTMYRDWWGVGMVKNKDSEYFDPVLNPLEEATVKDLDNYQWPKVDSGIVEGLSEKAKTLDEESEYAIFSTVPGLYEIAWYLTGMPRMLKAWVNNKYFIEKLLDKVLDVLKEFHEIFLGEIGEYLDLVQFFDDLGGQENPLFDPELYREVIKPRHNEMVTFIKKRTEAKVAQHCCGVIRPFLDDMIEIGIDVVNPVQVSAGGNRDTEALKQDYGSKIVFWGGVDTQRVLPFGNTEEVEQEVARRVKELGPGGGYILASVHNIQNDVPPENIVQMYETAKNIRLEG